MSELVDRVASAILNAEGVCWEDAKDWEKDQYRGMARSAIEAMREPTGDMWRAEQPTWALGRPMWDWWRSMIDAALGLPRIP